MKRLSVSDIMATTANIQSNDTHEINTDAYDETQADTSLDLSSLIDDVLASKSRIAPDLRVDDRDLKEFPNFYSWCFSKEGGNQAPFAKQLAFATHLLGEYCPRCSVKSFRNIAKVPVDFDAKDFPEKVTFLEFGKCVSGKGYVFTERGMIQVKDLIQDVGLNPFSLPIATKDKIKNTSHAGITKFNATTYRVRLTNGHYLNVTGEHPILTLDDNFNLIYKKLNELHAGDLVVGSMTSIFPKVNATLPTGYIPTITNNRSIFCTIKEVTTVTPELARLSAYLLADGTFTKYYCSFTKSDKNLCLDFISCIRSISPDVPIYTGGKIKRAPNHKGYYGVGINNKCFKEYLNFIGLKTGNFKSKRVPRFILESSKKIQIEFIRSLFDCDGYIQKGRVGIGLANPVAIRQISLMLTNLGLYNVINYKKTSVGNKFAVIHIHADFVHTFCTLIGTNRKSRKSVCKWNTVNLVGVKARTNSGYGNFKPGSLPNGHKFYDLLRRIHNVSTKEIPNCNLSYRTDSYLIEDLLASRFVPTDVKRKLKNLKNHSFHRIVEIRKNKKKETVYDFTVPVEENFIYNGIVVHNCPKCGARKSELVRTGELNFYQELALCAGQRCITGDSLVLTQHGLTKFEELDDNRPTNFSPYNVAFSSGTSMETATLFYKSNPESIYKVSLYNGTSIKGTKDHPIMTMNGFKRLPNITTDDYIRVYYGQNVFGCKELDLRKVTDIVDSKFDSYRQSVKTNNFKVSRVKPGYGKVAYRWLNEHIARLLGYIVSEGTARGISNNDVLVLDDCQSALSHMFSENLIKRYEQGVGWDNTYIRMYLEELLGYEFKGSAKFEVPLCIRQATKSIQVNFLSALFEGDGSAYADCIDYTSLSKDLVYQIHAMLLNIGIISRIKTKQTWASNGSDNQVSKTAYVLFIEGRNIELFHKEIGFQSKRKRSRVQKQIKRFNTRRKNMPFYYDKVPNDIKVEVLNIIREAKAELNQCPVRGSKSIILGLQSVYGVSGIDKLKRSSSPNVAMTYHKIKFFLEPLLAYTFSEKLTYKIKQCLSLCDEPYYYEKVIKVSQLKNKQVTYDVHIPNGHKFIANGILNHNSGKSAFFNLFVPYVLHKWVKVNKPVETLGLMKDAILIGSLGALTFQKANELLWQPISNAISDSKWWQQYFEILDYYGERSGTELYKFKDTFLALNHKQIIVAPVGPSKRKLRGACLVGSTLVNTNKGFVHMNELISKPGQHSINKLKVNSHRGTKRVSHTFLTFKPTLKLTTKNGYVIEGTKEHPVLVVTKNLTYMWKRLDKIQQGDWLVTQTKASNPMYNRNSSISKPLARLMGFLIANGHRTTIATDDKFVIKRVLKDHKLVTKRNTYWQPCLDGHASGGITLLGPKINGKIVAFDKALLEPHGYHFKNSADKEIPYGIRTASKEIIHQFLMAYFACDSYIESGDLSNIKNGKYNPEINLASRSEKLIRQIQTILLEGYGIVTRYAKRDFIPCSQKGKTNPKWSESHVLSLTGWDVLEFYKLFPNAKVCRKFGHRLKQATSLKGYGSDRRRVPYIREYLTQIWEKARYINPTNPNGRSKYLVTRQGDKLLNSIKPLVIKDNRNGCPYHFSDEYKVYGDRWADYKSLLRAISDKKTIKTLYKFLSNEAHYEEVVSIEHGSRQPVYDLTVPKGHCFYANGIASHNTRILGVLDEIGWFPHGEDNEQKEMANANEVYISLDRSLKTVRNATARLLEQGMDNIPNGYMAGISSPSSYNDKIMTLVRTHEGSREVLTGHFPTWEMNPMFKKEDFAKEYRDDPVKAERDFGANPPMAENPWISNVSQLNDLFDGRFNIKYQYNYLVNKSGKETVYAKVLGAHKPSSVPATVMAIDAGYSNNSFALSIVTPELGLGSRIKGARVLALLEVAPKKGQNVINFAKLFDEVVKPLIDQFNVKLVATDRWQSILLLQKLEEETGVATDTYSLRPADFEYIRDYLLDDDQTLHFPKPEIDIGKIFTFSMDEYPHCFRYMPNAHLYHQFSTVNLDGRGNVDKGNGFTDDLLRATCLGISYCLNQEDVIKYKLDGAKVNEVRAIGTRQASSLTSGGTISAKATGGSFTGTGTSLGSRG